MQLVDKKKCTACGACASICPKSALKIKADDEGFYYPINDNKLCIECGACARVCPIINNNYSTLKYSNIDSYVLRHKDKSVLKESTSGGAFTAIVQLFLKDESFYAIYGAAEQKNLSVKHIRIDNIRDLNLIRKSKYVESYSGIIFRTVKKDILDGRKVIYSGTPCQIAGLRSYLQKDYNNLLTIEIVCHGVPTTLLLNKYIQYQEKKYHGKCEHIEYRSKKNSNWLNPKIRLEFNNQKIFERKSYASDDAYMIGFCKFLCLRENCSECLYASPERVADFTIADFWGIEESGIKMEYGDGVSLILANSNKAKKIIPDINNVAEITEINYDFAMKHNQQLVSPAKADPRRTDFLHDLKNASFKELRKKYLKPRNIMERMLSNLLSRKSKAVIKRFLGLKPTEY